MGLDVSSGIAVGISMDKFFTDVEYKDETYDVHDQRGHKTGKTATDSKIFATLPSGKRVEIGKKDGYRRYNLNFYDSMGFDGGESEDTELEIIRPDYENSDLESIIIGSEVKQTGSHRNSNMDLIEELDTETILDKKEEVRIMLEKDFGYTGEIKAYLITYMSY